MQSALGALQQQQQQRVGAARTASATANHARAFVAAPPAFAVAAVAAVCRAVAVASSSSSSSLRPRRRRPVAPPSAATAADDDAAAPTSEEQPAKQNEERKEYYDAREMPPLPLTVARVVVPELDHVVVDGSTEATRLASLAIFTEMWRGGDNYGGRLNRRSAITALCMYDRDDVAAARAQGPGLYPSIDLLERVYREGLDVEVVVEEK